MSDNQNNNNNLEAQCVNLEEEKNLGSNLELLKDSNKAGAACLAPKRKGSKYEVYHGQALQTGGGLHKDDLMENKKGKIISKKRHEYGKKAFDNIKNYCNKDKEEKVEEILESKEPEIASPSIQKAAVEEIAASAQDKKKRKCKKKVEEGL